MKTRFLTVTMAVVMSVVCLTGCSGYGSFSKASFISAAKNNGMKAVEDTKELTQIAAEPGKTKAMYYDIENLQIVEYLNTSLTDNMSFLDVEEFVYATESIGKSDDHDSCLTKVCFVTVKDSKTAEEIYENAIKPLRFGAEDGKKDGVTYRISYQGPKDSQNDGSTVELACGVYLKDNQIVWIRSDYQSTLKNSTVEGFCKSLGLVSPYTLS